MHRKTTLENGMRAVFVPRTDSHTVAVAVFVKCGTDYETPKFKGISHFVEHLPFKGTTRFPLPGQLSRAIESKGGEINAFTDSEVMFFVVKIASEHLALALSVLAEMLSGPLFEPAEIERERGVIFEELNRQTDDPQSHLLQDLWGKVLYGDQPAGWPTVGTKETIATIDRTAIVDHFGRFFRSKGMVLVAAGGFDEKRAEKLAREYFSVIREGGTPQKPKLFDGQKEIQVLVSSRNTKQIHLDVGVKLPGLNLASPERHTLNLLANLLGGNMSSRIFLSVRDRLGAAYEVSTDSALYTDRAWLATCAGADKSKAEQVIRLILDEHLRIAREGVPEKELEASKEFLKGTFLMKLDDPLELVYFYGGQELLLNRVSTPTEEIKGAMRVTPAQVQEMARDFFRPENLNLALIGPYLPLFGKQKFSRFLDSDGWRH